MVSTLEKCAFSEKLTIMEQDAGLHFLLRIDTRLSDESLTGMLRDMGIRIKAMSSYYHEDHRELHCLVVNYSNLKEENLKIALDRLEERLAGY